MRHRPTVAALLFAAPLAACGAPPAPPAPPPPPMLAYAVPDTSTVVYLHGDTTEVEVDAGGQTLTMDVSSAARLETLFTAAADSALEVTVWIRDFSARATNPLGAPRNATVADVSGPLSFTLDRRGRATVTERPEVRGAAAEFLSAETLAAGLLPRLPGRRVTPGATWTDTVTVETERPSGSIASTAVLSFTVAGDTLVEGTRLLLVRFQGRDERRVDGSQSGMEIVQDLQGESEGHFLWDPRRHVLVEWQVRSDLRGSMDLSLSPVPLSVRVRSTTTTRLQDD